MTIEALVAAAVATLTPFLVAGATKASETYGEKMANSTVALLSKIRGWLSEDDKSAGALRKFEAEPITCADSIEKVIVENLAAHPERSTELQGLMDGFGSRTVVRQRVEKLAGALVGIDVGSVRKGLDAYVDQQVQIVDGGATMTGALIRET